MQLHGEKIYLRPTIVADAHKSTNWLNDPNINQFLTSTKHITLEERKEFLDRVLQDTDQYTFSIIERRSNEYIGNVYLYNQNTTTHEAEIGIFIGETTSWYKGYATEAVKLILEFAKNNTNIHAIYANVLRENTSSISLFERCNFAIQKETAEKVHMALEI